MPRGARPSPLERPHDGVVSVAETRLGGAPVKVLPHPHTPIIFRRRTWEEAEHFLEHGKFREDAGCSVEHGPSREEAS